MANLLNLSGSALMNKFVAEPTVREFEYTGSVQSVTLNAGTYRLQCWGAQGGSYSTTIGGKGGYSVGDLTLSTTTTLYIYVGGQGSGSNSATALAGGFNGGGNGYGGTNYYFGSGGGASDVRVGTDSLYARVIVAGGGGGCGSQSTSRRYAGGYGGGESGSDGKQRSTSYRGGYGGTQTTAGTSYNGSTANPTNYNASLAAFGTGGGRTSGTSRTAGGGGGWYGGGFSASGGGGGGSGYIYTTSTKDNYPSGKLITDDYLLANASTILDSSSGSNPDPYASQTPMPSPSGGTESGHEGNGYVIITKI